MKDVKDKVVSDWWYNLPTEDKDRFMIGREWPDNIPDRIDLMRKFYAEVKR